MAEIRVLALLEALAIPGAVKAVLEYAQKPIRGQHGPLQAEPPLLTFDGGESEDGPTTAIRNI
jgi:hypothetical protein